MKHFDVIAVRYVYLGIWFHEANEAYSWLLFLLTGACMTMASPYELMMIEVVTWE